MKKFILHNDKGDSIEICNTRRSVIIGVVMGTLYFLFAIIQAAHREWYCACDDVIISFLFYNLALAMACENKYYHFFENCKQATDAENKENENNDDINEQK